jgi:hypothetical protein
VEGFWSAAARQVIAECGFRIADWGVLIRNGPSQIQTDFSLKLVGHQNSEINIPQSEFRNPPAAALQN